MHLTTFTASLRCKEGLPLLIIVAMYTMLFRGKYSAVREFKNFQHVICSVYNGPRNIMEHSKSKLKGHSEERFMSGNTSFSYDLTI